MVWNFLPCSLLLWLRLMLGMDCSNPCLVFAFVVRDALPVRNKDFVTLCIPP